MTGGMSQTNAAGNKQSGSASVKVDANGNVSGSLDYQYQTKGGTSLTASVSGGVEVQASEPIPSPGGGFDATYTLSDSKGVAVGAGKQVGGGPSVGFQAGSTDAPLETGTSGIPRTRSRRRHSVTMPPRSSSANASSTSRRPPRRAPWTSPSVRNAAGAICRGRRWRFGLAGGAMLGAMASRPAPPRVLRATCQRDRGRGHGSCQWHQGLGLVDQRWLVGHEGFGSFPAGSARCWC